MICKQCKRKSFYKHTSGALVCEFCATEASQKMILDDVNISNTPSSLKRKIKDSMQKLVKSKEKSNLEFSQYVEFFNNLLCHLLLDVSSILGEKEGLLCKGLEVSEVFFRSADFRKIYPKNKRKRSAKNPRTYITFDKSLISRVNSSLSAHFPFVHSSKEQFCPGVKLKALTTACAAKGLDPAVLDLLTTKRTKSCILLYLSSLYPEAAGEQELLTTHYTRTSEEFNSFGISSNSPLHISYLLPLVYLAILYTFKSAKVVLVGEIINWAYDNSVSYLTAYKHCKIPAKFVSHFKPLQVPSEDWVRTSLTHLDKTLSLNLTSEYNENYMRRVLSKLRRILELPVQLSKVAFSLYRTYNKSLHSPQITTVSPETHAAAYTFVALKLVYGLNDLPYTIELQKAPEALIPPAVLSKMAASADWLIESLYSFPSFSSLLSCWHNKVSLAVHQPFQICTGDLSLYFFHLEKCLEVSPHMTLPLPVQFSRALSLSVLPPSASDPFLQEEFSHFTSTEDPLHPLPADDFSITRKKDSNKPYSKSYLFALHYIAKLAGGVRTTSLNFLIDKLERKLNLN